MPHAKEIARGGEEVKLLAFFVKNEYGRKVLFAIEGNFSIVIIYLTIDYKIRALANGKIFKDDGCPFILTEINCRSILVYLQNKKDILIS